MTMFQSDGIAGTFSLSGRAAFISGASSGIGRHFAFLLANAGASVALAGRRSALLSEAVVQLTDAGKNACAVYLDVEDSGTIALALREACTRLGQPIDVLVNNAGVLYMERFLDQDATEVTRVFDTNLKGAFHVAQETARHMAEHGGGSIVNVASSAGLRSGGHTSSYGAAKAGLIHLTGVMALELAKKNIRVNAIAPGNIHTDMQKTIQDGGFEESIRRRIPMARFGNPDDLDGAMLLLASNAGRYITGVTLPVDGGQILSWM